MVSASLRAEKRGFRVELMVLRLLIRRVQDYGTLNAKATLEENLVLRAGLHVTKRKWTWPNFFGGGLSVEGEQALPLWKNRGFSPGR